MFSIVRFAASCCLAWALGSSLLAADVPSPEQLEFFEKQIRPLLVEHCSECHGAKKSEAGLRLDTKQGFTKGSDTGPIFVVGNVDGSKLIKALSYRDGETQMPPKGKLSDEKIAVFKKWLEMGSPWPADATGAGVLATVRTRHRKPESTWFRRVVSGQAGRRSSALEQQLLAWHLSGDTH